MKKLLYLSTLLLAGLVTTAQAQQTISIANNNFAPGVGKTLTLANTVTLAGTDGSTLNIGTGGTLGSAAFTAATSYVTLAGAQTFTGLDTFTQALTVGSTTGGTNNGNIYLAPSDTYPTIQFRTGTTTTAQMLVTDTTGAMNFDVPGGVIYRSVVNGGVNFLAVNTTGFTYGSATGGTYNGNIYFQNSDNYPGFQFRSGGTTIMQLIDNVNNGPGYFDIPYGLTFRSGIGGGIADLTITSTGLTTPGLTNTGKTIGGQCAMTSNTTGTITFNTSGYSETQYNTGTTTIASGTITLPSTSQPGEIVTYEGAAAITALTMAGGTVDIGAAPTTYAANSVLSWQSDVSGHWIRRQ